MSIWFEFKNRCVRLPKSFDCIGDTTLNLSYAITWTLSLVVFIIPHIDECLYEWCISHGWHWWSYTRIITQCICIPYSAQLRISPFCALFKIFAAFCTIHATRHLVVRSSSVIDIFASVGFVYKTKKMDVDDLVVFIIMNYCSAA